MKSFPLTCKIVLINLAFCQCCIAKFSFETIKSYLFKQPQQKIIQKEFQVKSPALLTINNIRGNITITEWEQKTIQMKATKEAAKEEDLLTVDIVIKNSDKKVSIKTVSKKESKTTPNIHYDLIVPQGVKINVATQEGNITIDQINAATKATTKTGNICVTDNKGIVVAHADCGSITINNSSGNIQASTEKGNINIDQSSRNVIAKTNKGTIYASCAEVPTPDKIILSAKSGNIILLLPNKVDAQLQAQTKKGKLTCEHYVTLKPQTVLLNKQTWAKVKKEVHGIMGTGESTISLKTKSGNIKVLKTKIT